MGRPFVGGFGRSDGDRGGRGDDGGALVAGEHGRRALEALEGQVDVDLQRQLTA